MIELSDEFKKLPEQYKQLDKKLDATLEAVKVSKWTPVIVAVSILAAFAMGFWVG